MTQRGWQLQLQPALRGIHTNRLIAKRLVGLAVGGQEPAGHPPPLAPLRLGEPGRLQVLASVQQPSSAADDADPTLRDPRLDTRQPSGEDGQAVLFLPPFCAAGVATDPSDLAAGRDRQPRPNAPDRPLQAGPLIHEVTVATLPLVVAGAGECSSPAAGRAGGQHPLPAGPVRATNAKPAALGQVLAGQPPEMLADLA
jgi:hypothetical protein